MVRFVVGSPLEWRLGGFYLFYGSPVACKNANHIISHIDSVCKVFWGGYMKKVGMGCLICLAAVFGLLWVLVAAALCLPGGGDTTSRVDLPVEATDVSAILADYEANETMANKAWKGRWLKVRMDWVDRVESGGRVQYMPDGEWSLNTVTFDFEPDDAVLGVRPGDSVTAICKLAGFVLNTWLNFEDCRFASGVGKTDAEPAATVDAATVVSLMPSPTPVHKCELVKDDPVERQALIDAMSSMLVAGGIDFETKAEWDAFIEQWFWPLEYAGTKVILVAPDGLLSPNLGQLLEREFDCLRGNAAEPR